MRKIHTITLKNDIKQLEVMGNELEAYFEANDIDFETANAIQLSLDELVTNVISYAYDDQEEHEIEIILNFHGDYVSVLLSDDGNEFNPFARPEVDTNKALEDRQVGGLGIHLVKNMMDEFDYKREGQKNHISLKKFISKD